MEFLSNFVLDLATSAGRRVAKSRESIDVNSCC